MVVICQDAVHMEALNRNVPDMASTQAIEVSVTRTALACCTRIDKTNVGWFNSGGKCGS